MQRLRSGSTTPTQIHIIQHCVFRQPAIRKIAVPKYEPMNEWMDGWMNGGMDE